MSSSDGAANPTTLVREYLKHEGYTEALAAFEKDVKRCVYF